MGLIKQIDDELGRLFSYMEDKGLMDNTLIVFTSDHGDYLGDHWLGEKEMFHEPSVHVPLIVVDPSTAADATRGTTVTDLVEAIDLLPTFLDYYGQAIPRHRLEGHSLLPWLHGNKPEAWRDAVFSELDYSVRNPVRRHLQREIGDCRCFMVRTHEWKYVHFEGYRAQLFDLVNDPQENHDLGADSDYASIREAMAQRLFGWLRKRQIRPIAPDELVMFWAEGIESGGVRIGFW